MGNKLNRSKVEVKVQKTENTICDMQHNHEDTNKTSKQKYPIKQLSKEIPLLEADLDKAYESFNHYVEDTICNLHFHLHNLSLNSINYKHELQIAKTNNLSSSEDRHDTQIRNLQSHFVKSINKSRHNIKRAHMKIASVISQHNLLFLPYYELKLYNQQLSEAKTSYLNQPKGIRRKTTYNEALQEMEGMLDDMHSLEYRINNLLNSTKRIVNSPLELSIDYYGFFNDHYKSLPRVD